MAAKPAKKNTARKPPAKGKTKSVNRKLENIDKGVDKADMIVDAMLKTRGLPDPDRGLKGKPAARKAALRKASTKSKKRK